MNRNIQQTSIRLLFALSEKNSVASENYPRYTFALGRHLPRAELVNYGTSPFVITDARMEIVAPFYHGQPDKPKGN